MTVSVILAHKGRDVVTIDPAETLAQAIKILAEKRIGAALVLGADRRIAGIISERDIVRALAERGAAALDEQVSRTMTRKVETCNESETVASIMERMTAGKFRHLPVVDQGRLVGLVSIGDIVKHRVHEMERDSVAMRDYIMTAYAHRLFAWRLAARRPAITALCATQKSMRPGRSGAKMLRVPIMKIRAAEGVCGALHSFGLSR